MYSVMQRVLIVWTAIYRVQTAGQLQAAPRAASSLQRRSNQEGVCGEA